jgi:hypothetical protein
MGHVVLVLRVVVDNAVVDDDDEDDEDASPPVKPRSPPFPSGLIALVVATAVAFFFVYSGYDEMRHPASGCDGGLCVLSLVMGVIHGGIAWIVVFPLSWLLIAAVRRLGRS